MYVFRNIHNKQSREEKKRKQKVYKIRFLIIIFISKKKQSTKHHTATTTKHHHHQRFKINPDNDNNGLFFDNIYFLIERYHIMCVCVLNIKKRKKCCNVWYS